VTDLGCSNLGMLKRMSDKGKGGAEAAVICGMLIRGASDFFLLWDNFNAVFEAGRLHFSYDIWKAVQAGSRTDCILFWFGGGPPSLDGSKWDVRICLSE
jgi:hypothetical protein